MKIKMLALCLTVLFLAGCSKTDRTGEQSISEETTFISETEKESSENRESLPGLKTEQWTIDDHGPIYAYMPDDLAESETVPLVLAMNCTSGNPQGEVLSNGWDQKALQERFVVIAPTYNDYATYSEVDYIIQVLDSAESRYNIDPERVYSTGFSNGGALSVALASEHPERIAAISAAGWIVGARNTGHGYQMPFQLLQGTEEFTEQDSDGNMEIMDDEKEAIADLFSMNGMDRGTPDYKETPYWGYQPDLTSVIYPEYTDYDWQGNNSEKKSGVRWTISDYYTEGDNVPFAEFILIDGAGHVPHSYHAAVAWEFFRHFKRNGKEIIATE